MNIHLQVLEHLGTRCRPITAASLKKATEQQNNRQSNWKGTNFHELLLAFQVSQGHARKVGNKYRITAAGRQRLADLAKAHTLTKDTKRLLRYLNTHGRQRFKPLPRALRIKRSTLYENMENLEHIGFIESDGVPIEGVHYTFFNITPAGEAALAA